MIRTGGGRFDRSIRQRYFLAASTADLALATEMHGDVLVPMNEFVGERSEAAERVAASVRAGATILLDSGVFILARKFAAKEDVPLREAFRQSDATLGVDELAHTYRRVVRELEPDVWGYVEIDAGDTEAKVARRTLMEAEGLRPIPVYHPLSDPPAYFDALLGQYDRVAIGNLAGFATPVRIRLMATVWEKARHFPDVWVHLLGVTPCPALVTYPFASCDSSVWLSAVRYSILGERSALATVGSLPLGWRYRYGAGSGPGEVGVQEGSRLSAYLAHMSAVNWRALCASQRALFGEVGRVPA